MNLTKDQVAAMAQAVEQYEQELHEIREDPDKFIKKIQANIDLFNAALDLRDPLALINIPQI